METGPHRDAQTHADDAYDSSSPFLHMTCEIIFSDSQSEPPDRRCCHGNGTLTPEEEIEGGAASSRVEKNRERASEKYKLYKDDMAAVCVSLEGFPDPLFFIYTQLHKVHVKMVFGKGLM